MSHPGGALLAASYPTPAGPLVVVVDPHAAGDLGPADYGAVVLSTFRALDEAGDRLGSQAEIRPRTVVPFVRDVLQRYADGDLDALDDVSVTQPGGPFQQRAWRAMRDIRAGSVDTYAGLAARAGIPGAARAAGTVCAQNLVAPFVPCHRIVAADGLGGYGYGLETKIALLEHEGVLL
ncbi:MAG: methylated-DNA--[protein]-cysteine S-methyltransferase [Candidatus Nanopelagicales bacterium]|jgi:methylated-DNA-[protein]-cysteine S-methyltransferase